MADKVNSLMEEIKNLTVLQLSELVKALEEEFGVSAAAPAAVAAAPADGGGASGAEEQSAFDVVLLDAGASKMGVIKLVKDITGLGLKESKELVDGAPSTIKEALDKDAAEALKTQLEEAGAKIELK